MTAPQLCADLKLHRPKLDLDVSIRSESGRLALFGPSGAGKTTILKLIAGLLHPISAKVSAGNEIWDDTEKKCHVPAHERRAAIVFQDDHLFPHMSVRRNIAYGRKKGGQPDIDQLISMTGINELLARSVHTLSGGERKRVAIARALAASPALLLLDEPYVGLDRSTARKLRQDIRLLLDQTGVPHILVSHHLDDVLAHAEEVALIEAGKVVGFGSPDAVFASAEGRRLAGASDETLTGGPLTILKVAGVDAAPGGGLHRWYLPNGLELILPTAAHHAREGFVKIRGADVALSRNEPVETSVLNILKGDIAEIVLQGGFADVRLDLGSGVFLTSRITSYSAAQLGLQQGETLYAMIKSAALTS